MGRNHPKADRDGVSHGTFFFSRLCVAAKHGLMPSSIKERIVAYGATHILTRRPAKAVAMARVQTLPAVETLIISVLTGLLSGAVWMLAT
ncbi:MAG: hypothetical protein ACK4Z5_07520 [Brevundimonas sp.]